ncbi:hypothetical protein [Streptomyces chartreusis]|uniref:hypothetical protein n=1 Tax=Streptomyces chartreusis TaxID=1969 RepID=UPI0033F1C6BA
MPTTPHTAVPDAFKLRGQTFSGLDTLPREQALLLYRGLVKYSHACGCGAGAAGAALGASLHLLGLALLPTLVAAVVCGATGKCLGLWWARRRFDAAARSLATALRARTGG